MLFHPFPPPLCHPATPRGLLSLLHFFRFYYALSWQHLPSIYLKLSFTFNDWKWEFIISFWCMCVCAKKRSLYQVNHVLLTSQYNVIFFFPFIDSSILLSRRTMRSPSYRLCSAFLSISAPSPHHYHHHHYYCPSIPFLSALKYHFSNSLMIFVYNFSTPTPVFVVFVL